jgi:hypothetical protein
MRSPSADATASAVAPLTPQAQAEGDAYGAHSGDWLDTALTGQAAEAERWAAILGATSFDLSPADGTASFDSARAMLRALICGSQGSARPAGGARRQEC